MMEIITRKEPYPHLDIMKFRDRYKLEHGSLPLYVDNLQCPDYPELKVIMKACFKKDPNQRPSFQTIINLLQKK